MFLELRTVVGEHKDYRVREHRAAQVKELFCRAGRMGGGIFGFIANLHLKNLFPERGKRDGGMRVFLDIHADKERLRTINPLHIV